MHKLIFCLFILTMACGFVSPEVYRQIRNESFTTGELLEYRAHYGFINIGEGKVAVSPVLANINNRACYQVTVSGKTSGTFDLAYKVRNTWGSYIDTAAMVPQQFFRHIQENKYRKEETLFFDHLNKTVHAQEKNQQTKAFYLPDNVQDLASSFYYLRTVHFNQLHPGDTITVPVFFDNEFHAFTIRYISRGEVKTKFGKIKAFQLAPVMPANELFTDENAVRMWISDDMNRIPLKIEADLFVGAIELELKNYKGLKHALKFH